MTRIPLSPTSFAAVRLRPMTAEVIVSVAKKWRGKRDTMFGSSVCCVFGKAHQSGYGGGINDTSFIVHVLDFGAHAVHHCLC